MNGIEAITMTKGPQIPGGTQRGVLKNNWSILHGVARPFIFSCIGL